MLASHRRALRDISVCRTAALGGEVYFCSPCQEFRYSYHSCKNRHCPKCGKEAAQVWLQRQLDKLLPVNHFLVTFTLPEKLRKLARRHQKAVYRILMKAAAEALQKLACNPRWVGGRLGIVSVLQTWTRDLRYHPHVHMIVTGGGLSHDGEKWMPAAKNFLLPASALSEVFRGKFRDALKAEGLYESAPSEVWSQDWVVDILPVATGHAAFRYLAPYIFRVALSNNRLVSLKDDQVTFRYQDSKTGKTRYVSLPAEQFIHRFLQHVLPLRFRKVRYYGLFSPHSKRRLARARQLLGEPPCQAAATADSSNAPAIPTAPLCPRCNQPMALVEKLPRLYTSLTAIRAP